MERTGRSSVDKGKRSMKRIVGLAFVFGLWGFAFAACGADPECGPDGEPCPKRVDPGSGTWVPGGGFQGGGKKGDGGSGGEGGAGGAGGVGGTGGDGGAGGGSHLDPDGNCRVDALPPTHLCAPTYPEATGIERCASPNCELPCGVDQLVVDTPCAPFVRCAYDAFSMELIGAVVLDLEPTFCEGAATTLIYGDACTENLGACWMW